LARVSPQAGSLANEELLKLVITIYAAFKRRSRNESYIERKMAQHFSFRIKKGQRAPSMGERPSFLRKIPLPFAAAPHLLFADYHEHRGRAKESKEDESGDEP
jgi:hypothetical protein